MAAPSSPAINPTSRRKKTSKRKSRHASFSFSTGTLRSSQPESPDPPTLTFDHWSSPSDLPPSPPRLLGPQLSRWARPNIVSSRWWIVAEPSQDELLLLKTRKQEIQPPVERWEDKFHEQSDDDQEEKDEYTGMLDYDYEDPEDKASRARMGMRF